MLLILVTVFTILETFCRFFLKMSVNACIFLPDVLVNFPPAPFTYSTEDLLAAINAFHQFVDVPFHPTFFLKRMWDGMAATLRAYYEAGRVSSRRRSVVEIDYTDYLESPAVVFRSFFRNI